MPVLKSSGCWNPCVRIDEPAEKVSTIVSSPVVNDNIAVPFAENPPPDAMTLGESDCAFAWTTSAIIANRSEQYLFMRNGLFQPR